MQGVNKEFSELKREYFNKWVSNSRVTEPGIPSLLLAARGCQHVADVKDLLSHYIGTTDDGRFKAFV